jgi:hypothetical protein
VDVTRVMHVILYAGPEVCSQGHNELACILRLRRVQV